jgi:hypothetical protein
VSSAPASYIAPAEDKDVNLVSVKDELEQRRKKMLVLMWQRTAH